MKRILAALLLIGMAAGMLAGCGGKQEAYVPTGRGLTYGDAPEATRDPINPDEKEQELALAYYPDRSLNPYTCADATNRVLFSLIYQSLFVVDKNTEVHPLLCKTFSVSSDMMAYVIYLQDATFADGTALTANDVVASLKAAWDSELYGGRFAHVIDIYENFDGGVKIETDTPYENFFLLLDIPIVKASEVEAKMPMGTGPYQFSSAAAGKRLVRRQNWWCNVSLPVSTSAIRLISAQNATAIRDEFQFGDVGLVCADPGSDTYVDYRCDYELWDTETGMFLYLGFNTKDSKVFSNQKVRAAVTHAIDRDFLVEQYYQGFAQAAALPASPMSPWYSPGLASRYEYDKDVLTEALTAAGMQGSKVNLLVNSFDSHRVRVAKAIEKMLEDCGLDVEIVEHGDYYQYVLDSREFQDPITAEPMTYDLYLGQTKLSANMDLSAFFREYGMLNAGEISDAGTYSLCLDSLANSGNYYNLHERVMEQGFICPILFRSYAIYATRGLLTGLTPARDNVFYYDFGTSMQESQVDVAEAPPETEPETTEETEAGA